MTRKEAEEIAKNIIWVFGTNDEQEENAKAMPEEFANDAITAFRSILENNPKIRHEIWQFQAEHILDSWGLDYGE